MHSSNNGSTVDHTPDLVTIETSKGVIYQINELRDGSLNLRCLTGSIAVRPVMTGRVEIVEAYS